MLSKKVFLNSILLGTSSLLFNLGFIFAQNTQINRTNNWYFGGGAGINFNGGSATAVTDGQMYVYAGCATMSDTLGNLLMYTDGQTVWNKNHQIMPNGTGLLGDGTPVQSSIIIPKPLDDNHYYIFTCAGYDGNPNGIRYSIVDMTLNNGLGDISIKNELLFQPSSEQLGATMHANCTDVWITSHELNSNKYRAYLLTSNGIDTNNVVINEIGNFGIFGQHLKFSPNGKKMAAVNYWDNINLPNNLDTLELFDFNSTSGILTNLTKLPDTSIVTFEFSHDSKFLYVSNFNTERANLYIIPGFEEIFQYDLSSNNGTLIKLSKTLVYEPLSTPINNYNTCFCDFQLSPDNKIYVSSMYDSLSVINYPNLAGVACNIEELIFSLNGKTSFTKLPNFVSSYFDQDSTGCFYSAGAKEINEEQVSIHVYPNPFSFSTTIALNFLHDNNDEFEIALYDIFGRNIITHAMIGSTEQFSKESVFTLHKKNLNTGIYFLNIRINHKTYTQKVIIN
ncbi:MAG: T9SS type A sorting domain-containing protein [Flavobacteriales bacterium]|nr:T9SS type A sorting domain-containing protein [Flavobacteriales bacterium]